jgi:hypothetical protein
MQKEPFDRGSMRECYRMICTDPFGESHSSALDWKHIPVRRERETPLVCVYIHYLCITDGTNIHLFCFSVSMTYIIFNGAFATWYLYIYS